MFEAHDLAEVTRLIGRKPKLDKQFIYLEEKEIERLCNLVEEDPRITSTTAQKKTLGLRALALLFRYSRSAETVADKAALLGAALALAAHDPAMGNRVLSMMSSLR